MDFFLNPSIWIGLFTLIILEIILGVDNLIFLAILVEKLPRSQRNRARTIGLSLALFTRLILLSIISWVVTFTTPIISNSFFCLSIRDIILLLGGFFLLFKAIIELHERLEHNEDDNKKHKNNASFWAVIIQIIILDAVFSMDSIITAVGMVNCLSIMIIAVIISMIIMLITSKKLTNFILLHKTVVVLCLSFLLMIGLNLIAEALGAKIPKGYLYTSISFSILIELFNQIAKRNSVIYQSSLPLRQRAAAAILRFMKEETKFKKTNENLENNNLNSKLLISKDSFQAEEKYMIHGVLTLAIRSIRSIMTPRNEISWININQPHKKIRNQLLDTPHSLFPVCKQELDEIIGVVRAKEFLFALDNKNDILDFASKNQPIIIPDTLDPINVLNVLKCSKGNLIIVNNEFGVIQGLITPVDILEAIAGEFPDADETPDIINEKKNCWLVKGSTDIYYLKQTLNITNFNKDTNHASLAGFLISQQGRLPYSGEIIKLSSLHFHILESTKYRINLVRIKYYPSEDI
ncbi:TerC family protein [Buchnera aphidicola (Mollitrichosiphum nigrofasciatum)]|uniref:TerC family protein n=1 Tax=Buchnera aphidicola TaxID=9 RepID=UPI0031B7F22C